MSAIVLTKRDERLLKLVVEGASNKAAAKALDIEPGTVRVYYHQLYKKLGVKSKIGALTWYLRYLEASREDGDSHQPAPASPTPVYGLGTSAEFGDYALAGGLLTVLGIHTLFLGPNSRIWEVLHGQPHYAVHDEVRSHTQAIWEMFIEGDFAAIAALNSGAKPGAGDHAWGGLTVAVALVLAGNSKEGERLAAQLDARNATGNFARSLLRALQDSVAHRSNAGLAYLTQLASETPARNPHKHLAMVTLFHLYRLHDDTFRAKAVANAIFCEAELVRNFLETRCNTYLYSNTALPPPATFAAEELGVYEVTAVSRKGGLGKANEATNETTEQGEPVAVNESFYCDDRR